MSGCSRFTVEGVGGGAGGVFHKCWVGWGDAGKTLRKTLRKTLIKNCSAKSGFTSAGWTHFIIPSNFRGRENRVRTLRIESTGLHPLALDPAGKGLGLELGLGWEGGVGGS